MSGIIYPQYHTMEQVIKGCPDIGPEFLKYIDDVQSGKEPFPIGEVHSNLLVTYLFSKTYGSATLRFDPRKVHYALAHEITCALREIENPNLTFDNHTPAAWGNKDLNISPADTSMIKRRLTFCLDPSRWDEWKDSEFRVSCDNVNRYDHLIELSAQHFSIKGPKDKDFSFPTKIWCTNDSFLKVLPGNDITLTCTAEWEPCTGSSTAEEPIGRYAFSDVFGAKCILERQWTTHALRESLPEPLYRRLIRELLERDRLRIGPVNIDDYVDLDLATNPISVNALDIQVSFKTRWRTPDMCWNLSCINQMNRLHLCVQAVDKLIELDKVTKDLVQISLDDWERDVGFGHTHTIDLGVALATSLVKSDVVNQANETLNQVTVTLPITSSMGEAFIDLLKFHLTCTTPSDRYPDHKNYEQSQTFSILSNVSKRATVLEKIRSTLQDMISQIEYLKNVKWTESKEMSPVWTVKSNLRKEYLEQMVRVHHMRQDLLKRFPGVDDEMAAYRNEILQQTINREEMERRKNIILSSAKAFLDS